MRIVASRYSLAPGDDEIERPPHRALPIFVIIGFDGERRVRDHRPRLIWMVASIFGDDLSGIGKPDEVDPLGMH